MRAKPAEALDASVVVVGIVNDLRRQQDGGQWPSDDSYVARTWHRIASQTTCTPRAADKLIVGVYGRPDLYALLIEYGGTSIPTKQAA